MGSNLHRQWLGNDAERVFDLFLSFYKDFDGTLQEDKLYCEYRPGKKVAGYSAILEEYSSLISNYKYVAFLDDDLQISSQELNKLLNIANKNKFRISQPSLTLDSYYSYAALLQDNAYEFRAVNFIEMMCPIFRSDMLPVVRQLFSLGLESGIDLIWCNTLNPSPGDFAVIDEIAVRHIAPVGARKAANGFVGSMRYEDHIFKVMKDYDIPWLPCVPFFGVTRGGKLIQNRAVMFWLSLRIFRAIWLRQGALKRALAFGIYWKHMMFKQAKNLNVAVDPRKRESIV